MRFLFTLITFFITASSYAAVVQARLLPLTIDGKAIIEYHVAGVDRKEVIYFRTSTGLQSIPYLPATAPKRGVVAAGWAPVTTNILMVRAYVSEPLTLYVSNKAIELTPREVQLEGPFLAFLGGRKTKDATVAFAIHQVPPAQFFKLNREDVVLQTGPLVLFKEGAVLKDAYSRVATYSLENKQIPAITEPQDTKDYTLITDVNLHLAGFYPKQVWKFDDLNTQFNRSYLNANTAPYTSRLRGWFGIVAPFSGNIVDASGTTLSLKPEDVKLLRRALIGSLTWADTVWFKGWTNKALWPTDTEITEADRLAGYKKSLSSLHDDFAVAEDLLSLLIPLNDQKNDGVYYTSLWGKDNLKAVYIDTYDTPKDTLAVLRMETGTITESVENLPVLTLVNTLSVDAKK